jgi:hypothetical protein
MEVQPPYISQAFLKSCSFSVNLSPITFFRSIRFFVFFNVDRNIHYILLYKKVIQI